MQLELFSLLSFSSAPRTAANLNKDFSPSLPISRIKLPVVRPRRTRPTRLLRWSPSSTTQSPANMVSTPGLAPPAAVLPYGLTMTFAPAARPDPLLSRFARMTLTTTPRTTMRKAVALPTTVTGPQGLGTGENILACQDSDPRRDHRGCLECSRNRSRAGAIHLDYISDTGPVLPNWDRDRASARTIGSLVGPVQRSRG